MKVGRNLLAVSAAMLMAQSAMAQVQAPDAAAPLVFEPAFFAAFSPANAQQMVERLPGFSIEDGNSEMRGFSQAAGNVVINGQRPSSKEPLGTVLQRIPASRVRRIEISSGNAFGSDYAGKPQVANVILNSTDGLAGTVDARLAREFTGRLLPRGTVSAVYRAGASTFSGSLTFQKYSQLTEEGTDQVTDLPGGVVETRDVSSRNTEPFATMSLGWGHEEAPNRSAHINGKITSDKWLINQPSIIYQKSIHTKDGLYTEDHLWHIWELSGDVTRPLAGGSIKLNLLGTHRHRDNADEGTTTEISKMPVGFYSKFDDWRDERVARLSWSRLAGGWSLELGGEGAYNRLKTDLNYFSIAGTTRSQVDLLIDDSVVDEYRGETFINAGRNVASNLRLDLGLNYEVSRLTVTGDAHARRTLKFWKPKASLDWTGGGWHMQLSLKRTVAQLNFSDFTSTAQINTGQSDGGNAELVPERKWELLLSADRTILGDGRIKIDLGYHKVSQLQDRIPIRDINDIDQDGDKNEFIADSPGNLGDGRQYIARANLDLPLSKLGIKGGRLSLYGSYVDTNVIDPYTQLGRPFKGNALFAYTADFRQDLGSFAWGVSMAGNTGSTFFRRLETDTSQGISPKVNAFAEYRPSTRSTIAVGVENLTNGGAKRWRYFYTPDRTESSPDREEFRRRSNHALVYLSIKHSFG